MYTFYNCEYKKIIRGGGFRGRNISLWEISYFKCVRNFPLNFHCATVRNKPGAKFSHWGAFLLPLCSLAFELLSVGRGWRRPLKSGLPPWLEGVYTLTVNADVPGRGKGSGLSRIRVRDLGTPVNEVGVCCAQKQMKGRVLDCLEPWGMGLRSRSCRNPLKVKNVILEAPGSSPNNPAGTSWNLAVQGKNCSIINSTILEGCEISRRIFRPLCEINPVRNFLVRKILGAKIPPPLYSRVFFLRQTQVPPPPCV